MLTRIMEQICKDTILTEDNNTRIRVFNEKLSEQGYKRVPLDLLVNLAIERFFKCYTVREIMNILQYFDVLQEK